MILGTDDDEGRSTTPPSTGTTPSTGRACPPTAAGSPSGELAEAIERDFGSYDAFRKELADEAETHFGSGWAWLVHDGSKLLVTSTHDADLPLKHSQRALLTIDVWEHAYYVDYRNRRPDYIAAFLDELVSWDFVAPEPRRG